MDYISCEEIKELLLTAHDRKEDVPAIAARHLDQCASCRHFSQFLLTFGSRLKGEFDTKTNALGRPDMDAVIRRQATRSRYKHRILALSGIAAAVLISISSLFIVVRVRDAQTKIMVWEEAQYFVDDLFSQPLFEGVENVLISE